MLGPSVLLIVGIVRLASPVVCLEPLQLVTHEPAARSRHSIDCDHDVLGHALAPGAKIIVPTLRDSDTAATIGQDDDVAFECRVPPEGGVRQDVQLPNSQDCHAASSVCRSRTAVQYHAF